jgi:hypothetical protein
MVPNVSHRFPYLHGEETGMTGHRTLSFRVFCGGGHGNSCCAEAVGRGPDDRAADLDQGSSTSSRRSPLFDDADPAADPDHAHFYDQIAWFTGANGEPALLLAFSNAGMFNFADDLVPADTTTQLSWRMSDHFPLWTEFSTK